MNLRELVTERLYEPIHRQLFLTRQLRRERDYWRRECEKAESYLRGLKARLRVLGDG